MSGNPIDGAALTFVVLSAVYIAPELTSAQRRKYATAALLMAVAALLIKVLLSIWRPA